MLIEENASNETMHEEKQFVFTQAALFAVFRNNIYHTKDRDDDSIQ